MFLTTDPGSGQAKYLAESFRTPDPNTGYYVPIDISTMSFDPPLLIDDWQESITRTALTKIGYGGFQQMEEIKKQDIMRNKWYVGYIKTERG